MQHHCGYLHLSLPRQVEAGIEERELGCPFQIRSSGPESVPERQISGSGQTGHGRTRIDDNPTVPGRVELEQRRRNTADTSPADTDPQHLQVVKRVELSVEQQGSEPGGSRNSGVSENNRRRLRGGGGRSVHQTVGEFPVEPATGLGGKR